MGFKTLNFGNKITLFAGTSRDWMIVAHAAFSQSITIATAYDTLGVDGLSFSLNEGGVRALFTTADLLLSTVTKVKSKVSSLEFVIYNGKPDESKLVKVKSDLESLGVKIYSLDDVHFIGINSVIDILPPKPQDIACIMYTSGSTGDPKGVILTHANLIG